MNLQVSCFMIFLCLSFITYHYIINSRRVWLLECSCYTIQTFFPLEAYGRHWCGWSLVLNDLNLEMNETRTLGIVVLHCWGSILLVPKCVYLSFVINLCLISIFMLLPLCYLLDLMMKLVWKYCQYCRIGWEKVHLDGFEIWFKLQISSWL